MGREVLEELKGLSAERARQAGEVTRKVFEAELYELKGLLAQALRIQHLLGQGGQACDILQQLRARRAIGKPFQAGLQDRDRCAQFVRGIQQEALLLRITLVEAGERGVDRVDQWRGFRRHVFGRQAHAAAVHVDARGIAGGAVEAAHCPAHHQRRDQQGDQRHQARGRQPDRGQHQQRHLGKLAQRERTARAGHDLHCASGGIHTFYARGRARGVANVPAQPGLADVVQRMADAREFRRHAAFAQPVALRVVDGEPQIRHLGAQCGERGGRMQHELSASLMRHCIAQYLQYAVFGFQRKRVAARPRPAEQDQQQRREQGDLQRHQAPHQPPAQRAARAHAGVSRNR